MCQLKKNGDFIKKQSVWVFWSNHVTELCEKWIYKNNEYAYTRFEKIYKYSGEVLYTREHKAIALKQKQNFINIDELKVFKGITKYNILQVYHDLYK